VLKTAAETNIKPGPLVKGDLLEILILEPGGPGISTFPSRIDQDGLVGLPYAGGLKLEGLSEAKAAQAIAKSYRDKSLIRTALVTVRRVQAAEHAEFKLGPITKGDILRLGIQDLTGQGVETIKVVKVDDQGAISLPLAGSVKIEGLSETGVSQAIARAYRDAHLIQNACVWALKINPDAPLPDEPAQPSAPPPAKAARR
jgi:protein involved in polysaccharide export with SLBB domain